MAKLSTYPVANELDGTERFAFTKAGANGNVLPEVLRAFLAGRPASFATWLQAKLDAAPETGFGDPAEWIWGNYELPAPVVINCTNNIDGFCLDAHGATFTPGWTDADHDMIRFTCPADNAFEAQMAGFRVQNLHLQGYSQDLAARIARNGLVLEATPGATGSFYGVSLINVKADNCVNSGIYLSGNVFEVSLYGCVGMDNTYGGLEVMNPSGGGIISSINVFGGDWRGNFYGIVSSSETAFQQTGGINVYAADFIVNNSAGIRAPRGINIVSGCHFENNCGNNDDETLGAIFTDFGDGVGLYNSNATGSVTGQKYLVDLGQSGGSVSIVKDRCYAVLSGADSPCIKGSVGTLYISEDLRRVLDVDGGTMNVIGGTHDIVAMQAKAVTAATYTVLPTDTHIICNRAGTVTLTLPDPAVYNNRRFVVRTIQAQTVISAGSNVVPLIGGSHGTAILAGTAGKWATLVSDGTDWQIMQGN